jgi:hypothetical protein
LFENNTGKYIDKLGDIVKDYNNTKHFTTKRTPYEVYFEGKKPLEIFYIGTHSSPKYKEGDLVRISSKEYLRKESLQNGVKKSSK